MENFILFLKILRIQLKMVQKNTKTKSKKKKTEQKYRNVMNIILFIAYLFIIIIDLFLGL